MAPPPPPLLSFLTDYGLRDGFVAACHGVIATIAPHAHVIDITHQVPPQDVRHGAAVLEQTVPYLPAGTVHLAVVDPGVGTPRRAVALLTPRGALVGPDNGLLLPAAEALGGVTEARELTERRFFREPVSRTFHGRDVFAPVAAHLALGEDPAGLGPALAPGSLERLPRPLRLLDRGSGRAEGQVTLVDGFGNVQTSLDAALLDTLGLDMLGLDAVGVGAGRRLRLVVHGNARSVAYGGTFGDVPVGELLAYPDSAGLIALAVNGGSAAELLRLATGDRIAFAGPG